MPMQLPEWVTVAAACREFGLDFRTIPRWIERGWIQSFTSRRGLLNNRYVSTKEIAAIVAEFTDMRDNEVTLRDAAIEYHISPDTLLPNIRKDRIKARKLHNQRSQPIWVLDRESLVSYLNGNKDRRKYNGYKGGKNHVEK